MQYIVISSSDEETFNKIVSDHLNEGWELVGGVSISVDRYGNPNDWTGVHNVYAQAMIH
jgi:hypothetical protein